MPDRKQTLRDHLSATRSLLTALAARLGPEDWERQVQTQSSELRWTAREMLAHLAAAERGQMATLKGIAAGGTGVPDDFDLNRWNKRQVERGAARTPAELLDELAASRVELLATLDALGDAELDRRGRHGRGDTLTVEQFFYRIGEHEAEHVTLAMAALGLTS
jgi:hypothetical protein